MHMTGHKSLTMVQRYAHLSPDFQEEAINALDLQNADGRHDNMAVGHDLGTVGDGESAAKAGAACRIRTYDPRITNAMLYQLS